MDEYKDDEWGRHSSSIYSSFFHDPPPSQCRRSSLSIKQTVFLWSLPVLGGGSAAERDLGQVVNELDDSIKSEVQSPPRDGMGWDAKGLDGIRVIGVCNGSILRSLPLRGKCFG